MNTVDKVCPALVIVAGVNDIEFLERLSSRLHTEYRAKRWLNR
jgi:hypothetical protein